MRLTTAGRSRHLLEPIIGRITLSDLPCSQREEYIRLLDDERPPNPESLEGYRAVLSMSELPSASTIPGVELLRHTDHFRSGDIVAIEPKSGFVRSLYRPAEKHHTLFVTERCNSNCLMCSQPPKDKEDTIELTERNLKLVELMKPAPDYITITGGEPTLLGKNLFKLLTMLRDGLPNTDVHMLTNGRTFAWPNYVQELASVQHPRFSVGIPLYSDVPGEHDYIVQAKAAFDQTITGLHRLARCGIRAEIRVVLHQLTIPRLTKLADFIYRNLTFVEHIALMGLENIGYTPRNLAELWIDPHDYQDELRNAVEFLAMRGMRVSIYNHQLCVLHRSLWPYAQKSISDWKNAYLPECADCKVATQCGGFFKWSPEQRSRHIHAL